MVSRLFKSLDVLLRRKHNLSTKASQLAQEERRLIQNLSRALAGSGYRVVPVAGQARESSDGRPVRRSVKRLRCPECQRTFAHPLPMARHVKATHHPDKAKKAAKTTRRAAKRAKKRERKKSA